PSDELPQSQTRALASMDRYAKAASRLGVITVDEHVDHTIREVKLARRHGQRHFVPLGVQMAATRLGVSRGKMAFLGGDRAVRLGDREIRGDDDFSVWLNWRGRGAFPVVSAVDVLDGTVDLAGRMVVVGYAQLAQDSARTPWGREPAALTHATLMDNILADDLLIRAGKPAELALVGLCGGLVVLGFLLPWRPARFLGALAGCAAAVVLPPAAFLAQGTWLPGVGALLAAFGGTLVAFTAAWLQEGSEARALRKAFAHYVSDELLAEMVKDPSLVQLAGQRRDLSILFSDIRSFTTYSERIEPLDLIGFLNHYLTPMTRAVMRNRGFVDKYIGDAVMALFGAPVPEEAHAEHACRAALDMFTGLDSVRPEAAKHGIDLAIGVGVNSGVVAVGNMGSADRLEYTVLGDAVNLASRLEGLTKTYGVFCLLGERTARALPPVFRVRRLDLVRVKGKEEPVEIFELCGDDRVTVVSHAEPEAWEAGVQAWRDGDFPTARAAFTRFRDANPDDRVAGLYLERMALLGEPPQPWDGVFTHQTK
ncbi:MAG: adenylate/guanylate cyclase domain-containing protein, partial [Myxococcales bacterium]|nr:adenylate/guanylate cyclase domain-containing protein [Myxococcales bacterium]